MTQAMIFKTATVIATLLGLFLLWRLREAVLIFLISLIVSAAIRPVTTVFRGISLSMSIKTIAAYAMFLGSLALLVFAIGDQLLGEIERGGSDLVKTYDYVKREWPQGTWIEQQIAAGLPPKDDLFTSITSQYGLDTLQTIGGLTFSAASLCIDFVLIIILSIYWSLDRVPFERLWLSLLPAPVRIPARDTWRSIETEVGSYLRSEYLQFVLAVILLSLGYWALGHRYPVLIAVLGAATWTLPWVGVILAVLAVLIMSLPMLLLETTLPVVFTTSAAGVYTCVVLLLLEFFIEPKLFSRHHYNMVLLAAVTISLAYAFGIAGLLIGPPTAVGLQVLGGSLLRQYVEARATKTSPDNFAELSIRVSTLQEKLDTIPNMSPELLSLVQRLGQLVSKSQVASTSSTAE